MAAYRSSRCTIDNLPEAQRLSIVDALISGENMSEIAKRLGISRVAVSNYRRKVVAPAVKVARKIQQTEQSKPDNPAALARAINSVEIAETQTLTKAVVQASPFRERLEMLWGRTDRALDRAEGAVRVVTDRETGELVAVGPDVAAIAPILNQAHRNIEMLGKVTGELEAAAAVQVAIQIVVPAGQQQPAVNIGQAVEFTAVEIGTRNRG